MSPFENHAELLIEPIPTTVRPKAAPRWERMHQKNGQGRDFDGPVSLKLGTSSFSMPMGVKATTRQMATKPRLNRSSWTRIEII